MSHVQFAVHMHILQISSVQNIRRLSQKCLVSVILIAKYRSVGRQYDQISIFPKFLSLDDVLLNTKTQKVKIFVVVFLYKI